VKSPTQIEAIDKSWNWVVETPVEIQGGKLVPGAEGHRHYQPLKENTALFLEFAQTPPTESGILAFANQYGMLGYDESVKGFKARRAGESFARWASRMVGSDVESVEEWVKQIGLMRDAVNLWQALEQGKNGKDSLLQLWAKRWRPLRTPAAKERARQDALLAPELIEGLANRQCTTTEVIQNCRAFLLTTCNAALQKCPASATLFETRDGDFQITFRPTGLLAAMWLQFAQAIADNYEIKICRGCGKPFQTGPGASRRAGATTCKDSCRQRAWQKDQKEKEASETRKEKHAKKR
jgi:hypothetical protein